MTEEQLAGVKDFWSNGGILIEDTEGAAEVIPEEIITIDGTEEVKIDPEEIVPADGKFLTDSDVLVVPPVPAEAVSDMDALLPVGSLE